MAEAVIMQQSYDSTLLTSWSTLMTEARAAAAAAGSYPTATFPNLTSIHGSDLNTTSGHLSDLGLFDINADYDTAWDQAFRMMELPSPLSDIDTIKTYFYNGNAMFDGSDIVDAFVAQREASIENQIGPNLALKFISNNCVFSSIYAQSIADMYKQTNADADKLLADLNVNLVDRSVSRYLDWLKFIVGAKLSNMATRADIALKRHQLQMTFAESRARLGATVNSQIFMDSMAWLKAKLAYDEAVKTFPLQNLKYVIAAQGAMQGVHTLSDSVSGVGAMDSFSKSMSYLSSGVGTVSTMLGLGKDLSSFFTSAGSGLGAISAPTDYVDSGASIIATYEGGVDTAWDI